MSLNRDERERARNLALAQARVGGCTCAKLVVTFHLTAWGEDLVRIKHARGCPRWEGIRPPNGDDCLTAWTRL